MAKFAPGAWPPRTDYLHDRGRRPFLSHADPAKQAQQDTVADREAGRVADDPPDDPPSSRLGRIWMRCNHQHCSACGSYGGRVLIELWREAHTTDRCRYCLHWKQWSSYSGE